MAVQLLLVFQHYNCYNRHLCTYILASYAEQTTHCASGFANILSLMDVWVSNAEISLIFLLVLYVA